MFWISLRLSILWQIVKSHFMVALLVGLIVGTLIGAGEGLSVLASQELFGRYNELVAWGIVVDASALIAVEFGFALISGLIFLIWQRVPGARQLVSLQLGETVFALTLAYGLWTEGMKDASPFFNNALSVVAPPALVGLLLGELVLAASLWFTAHAPFTQRLRARYWLLLEGVTLAVAIAFAFTR